MQKVLMMLIVSEPVSYSNTKASVVVRRRRPSSSSVNNLTIMYVDAGFSETVQQNSIKLGRTIIWKVLMMHVVQF